MKHEPATRPDAPPPTWRWPLFLIGLLVFGVVTQGVLLVVAVSDPRQHVEPDYYAKGLAWDEHMAEERASVALGWTVSWKLQSVAAGARIVQLTVLDANGAPVRNLSAQCAARHRADLGRRLEASLNETAPGTYEGAFAMRREGLWELRVVGVRGDSRYVTSQVIDTRGDPL